MSSKIAFLGIMLFAFSAFAAEPTEEKSVDLNDVCLFAKEPAMNIFYTEIHRVQKAKGVYGSVSEVMPGFILLVKQYGGNAVINFSAAQRFSILPWRFRSPVARGVAVNLKNDKGLTCAEMGAQTIKDFMPAQQ